MALTRRTGQRFQASIWPGFVDAMTALLLVLMFVLSIFMIVQSMLRDTITGQENELSQLNAELSALAEALGLEQQRTFQLETQIGTLSGTLAQARVAAEQQATLIATLSQTIDDQAQSLSAASARIADFEAQVASLLAERDAARDEGAALRADLNALEAEKTELLSAQEQLQLALARARTEIDASAEAARLAAAQREALEALVTQMRADLADTETARLTLSGRVDELEEQLSEGDAQKLAEAEAARLLRERLANAQDELTAMTLALEEQRKQAEETLTLLAAAETAEDDLNAKLAAALLDTDTLRAALAGAEDGRGVLEAALTAAETSQSDLQAQLTAAIAARDALQAEVDALRGAAPDRSAVRDQLAAALAAKLAAEQEAAAQLSAAQRQEILLAQANEALATEEAKSAESQRKIALLNQQIAQLRAQLGSLQALLDDAASRDAAAKVQLESLGNQLNAALARAASEQRARAELEEAERIRLEAEAARLAAEAKDLENYRSEFFGRLRQVLAGREGVRIEGDRFVFSSEVLFEPASADLSAAGQDQIANVVSILRDVSGDIPSEIDWIIRVDGHTDKVPLAGTGRYRDNWELSQGRALSVVRYMTDALGFDPSRLAATGFGEYRPAAEGDTPEAYAQNRRIELKLTER